MVMDVLDEQIVVVVGGGVVVVGVAVGGGVGAVVVVVVVVVVGEQVAAGVNLQKMYTELPWVVLKNDHRLVVRSSQDSLVQSLLLVVR